MFIFAVYYLVRIYGLEENEKCLWRSDFRIQDLNILHSIKGFIIEHNLHNICITQQIYNQLYTYTLFKL